MRNGTGCFKSADPHRPIGQSAKANVERALSIGCVTLACLGLNAAASQGVSAQSAPPPAPNAVPASPGETTPTVAPTQRYTDDEIKLLVGPVALYPDSLLANTLTACLYPDQVAAAARMCASGSPPTQAQIDATDWELPVKAIAAVPTVVNTLNQYPDWMRALGSAYLKQPSDVMRVTQQLRTKAIANGALKSDDQQIVAQSNSDGGAATVTIVSTNPQLIAVPIYSPEVVYADPDVYVAGYPAGYWGYASGVYVGPGFGAINCDWYRGYCAWGNAVYNPAWDHVGVAGVNTLHDEWNQRQRPQNAAVASAVTPGPAGSAFRGVGDVGSPYRPGGVGGVGAPRMPAPAGIPGNGRVGGLGSVGGPAGLGQVGGPGGAGQVGGPGGVGRVNGPGGYGPSWGAGGAGAYGGYGAGGDRSVFSGDRRSSASSQRGASSSERSADRGGGGGGGAGGGGRR